jgi:hypothetical protein
MSLPIPTVTGTNGLTGRHVWCRMSDAESEAAEAARVKRERESEGARKRARFSCMYHLFSPDGRTEVAGGSPLYVS